MAEAPPKIEQYNSGQVLKERKGQLAALKKELDATKEVVKFVVELHKQNEFYEREIDGARGKIFKLLVAHVRIAEAACSELYTAQVQNALDLLTNEDKKAKTE